MSAQQLMLPARLDAATPLQPAPIGVRYDWFPEIRRVEAPRYIVADLLPSQASILMFGESNAGKSFAALDAGLRLAAGAPVFGRATTRTGVVYVTGEGGNGMRARIEAFKQAHPTVAREDLPFVLITDELRLYRNPEDLQRLCISLDEIQGELGAQGGQLGLIALDTCAQLFSGADENSSVDVGRIIEICEFLRRRYGCSLLLIHHSGKNASLGSRGHSKLPAAFDAVLEVKRAGNSRGTLTVTKMRDGETGLQVGFKLEPITLAFEDNGAAITSCVVRNLTSVIDDNRERPAERALIAALDETLAAEGKVAGGRYHLPELHPLASRRGVFDRFAISAFAATRPSKTALRQAFNRTAKALEVAGAIGSANETNRTGWMWRTPAPQTIHCDDP